MSVRVLKIVPTLLCGGTEKQAITLAASLDPSQYEVEVACLRRRGPLVGDLSERNIPLSEYPIPGFYSRAAVEEQAKFAKHLIRQQVDVVHAYSFYGNVFGIPPARMAGVPVVIASIRDRGAYLTKMQKRVQRYVCRLADCVLVNAQAVKDWLVSDGYNASKVVVIPNGVDLQRFKLDKNPVDIRRSLGFAPDVRIVAVVSRLTRQKGLEQFLAAAAELAARFDDVRFVVAGEANPDETEYENVLRVQADQLGISGRVTFIGACSDVAGLLGSVSVSVMPSLNEALSNVLLESMAASAPIVATRVGGTPEAVVDEETGLLVPPDDVPALVKAIERLLVDRPLAERLGRAARYAIERRFSLDRMVSTTEQLYRDLLARKQKTLLWRFGELPYVRRSTDHY